jgi:hypothetical protein
LQKEVSLYLKTRERVKAGWVVSDREFVNPEEGLIPYPGTLP